MAKRQQTREEIRHIALGRLAWHAATRDDQAVAQAIQAREEIDALYSLDEVSLLDEFYRFLEMTGFLQLIEGLALPGVRRMLIPVVYNSCCDTSSRRSTASTQ